MNKIKLFSTILILNLFFIQNIFSQISYGSKPYSFDKKIISQLKEVVPTKTMEPINSKLLQAEDAVNDLNKDIPWRFGKNIEVDYSIYNAGTWDYLPNGDKLWRLRIYSPGAYTLNFGFDKFILPEGAKLFFYNENRSDVLGAFTNKNNSSSQQFATTLIQGDAITIEYYEPSDAEFSAEIVLNRVTHGYRNVFEFTQKAFGGAGACQRNVACSPDSVGWSNQIRSVCMLVVGGSGFCTGSLINNTANDATPYVLTANHCSTSNDFAQWIFWFNWQSATCTNPGTTPAHDQVTTSGSALKARNAGSDFCLVQMNQTPPCTFNPYYSGWSRSTTPATSACGIHHPSADIKKISLSTQAAVSATYSGASCWQIFWGTTCTEPGSSGSPIFDQNHRIIGQLYGGPSSCGAAPSSMNDYYGQLAVSWTGGGTSSTRLSDWLDPLGTAPQFIDGYDPCATPPVSLDAELNSITEPVATYCSAQTITPTVVIRNVGTTTLTSLEVSYDIDGGTPVIQTWTGSLATNQTANITFATITLTLGNHTFNSYCSLPNGGTDMNTSNDSKSKVYDVSTGMSLPFTEGFEGTFLPTNWTVNNPDGATTWAQTASSGNGTSTLSAFVDFYNYSTTNQQDELITPAIYFPVGESIEMTFKVAYRQYQTENDQLQVFVSTDCGATYNATPVYDKAGATLATLASSTTAFTPAASGDWRMETINLSAFAGNSVKIKFLSTNQYGNNLYVDDINIYSLTTPPVAGFSASPTTTCIGQVQFTDNSTSGPSTWLWDFGDGQTSTAQNPLYTYTTNGTYSVTLTVTNNYGTDAITQTNYININLPVSPIAYNDSTCGSGSLTLNATGSGTLHWFDAPTGGTDLGTGNTFTTPVITSTTTYYVEDQIQTIGANQNVGSADSITNGSYLNSATEYWLTFDVLSDVRLVSVIVNASGAGTRTIYLRDNAGTTLQTLTPTLTNGINVITLNWDIPVGIGYRLVGGANCNLWRNNAAVTFPYSIANLISITGANVANRYYYFYNWTVQSITNCTSARVPVDAIIYNYPTSGFTYTTNGNVFDFTSTSSNATSYLWDFGDGTTSTLQNPSHTYSTIGNFSVLLTVTNNCGNDTTSQNIIITNVITYNTLNNIDVYPNPVNNILNVCAQGNIAINCKIEISDVIGNVLYKTKSENKSTIIDFSKYQKGIYFVKIVSGNDKKTFKVVHQ